MAELHPAQGRFPTLALWPLAVAGLVAGVFWWFILQDAPQMSAAYLTTSDRDAANMAREFSEHARRMAYAQGIVISGLALVLAAFVAFYLGRTELARREIAHSEQRLREAIEGLPDGFVLFDANDKMVLWNEKYLLLLPYLRDLPTLRGLTYEEICRAGLAAGVFADSLARTDPERWLRDRVRDHRSPPAEPTELLLASGSWILLRERRTADGGVVGVRTDITELKRQEITLRSNQERLQGTVVQLEVARRQLEQQADALTQLAEQNLAAKQIAETAQRAADEARKAAERANRAKSRFLANMSHELRTPLNAIIGFSEIMKSELLGPMTSARYRDYVRDIHASGKHLMALISDILDMSKIEAEKFTLHPGPVNVVELATECSRMLQVRAVKAKLALVVDVDGDLNIIADERAITQMLLNLLSNAIKFTPAGGLVTLRARPEGEGIILQVIDTGIGIKPENLPALGGRFEQVDNVYTRTLEGSGLGLAISRGLAQLHGGSLQIESAVGKGTTMTIRLPRQHTSSAVSAA